MRRVVASVGLACLLGTLGACDDAKPRSSKPARPQQLEVRRWKRAKSAADEARELARLLPRAEREQSVRILVHIEAPEDERIVRGTDGRVGGVTVKDREGAIRARQNHLLASIERPADTRTTFFRTVSFLSFDASVRDLRALAPIIAAGGVLEADGSRSRVHAEAVTTLRKARTASALAEVPLADLLARVAVDGEFPTGQGRRVCIIDTPADARVSTLLGRVESTTRVTFGYPSTTQVLPALTGAPPAVLDHGTQCACVAAAVAPGSQIVSLAVDNGAGGYLFDNVLAALDLLVNAGLLAGTNGLDVVSISLGDPETASLDTCGIDATQASCFAHHIENLGALGVVVAVAAGNSGLANAVEFPACVSNAMTVGATDGQFARRAGYSNWGAMVDLAAPGSDLLLPGWAFSLPSGTSISTPFAAGLVARLRERHPLATAADVVDSMVLTGEGFGASPLAPTTSNVPEIRADKASTWLVEHAAPGGG